MEKFKIFPILNIPEYAFKTLIWGHSTVRKEYLYVLLSFGRCFSQPLNDRSVSNSSTIIHWFLNTDGDACYPVAGDNGLRRVSARLDTLLARIGRQSTCKTRGFLISKEKFGNFGF